MDAGNGIGKFGHGPWFRGNSDFPHQINNFSVVVFIAYCSKLDLETLPWKMEWRDVRVSQSDSHPHFLE